MPKDVQSLHQEPTEVLQSDVPEVQGNVWRSPESLEKRRLRNNQRHRERYWTDEEYRQKSLRRKQLSHMANKEKENERRRKYYEAHRDEHCERRRQWDKDNRERARKTHREYYAKHNREQRDKIREAKHRRNPTIGLYSAIQHYKAGRITFGELDLIFRQAHEAISNRLVSAGGVQRDEESGPVEGGNGLSAV